MYQSGMNTKQINSAKYGTKNGNNQEKSQLGQAINNTLGVFDGLEQLKSGDNWSKRAKGVAQIITSMMEK